MRYLVFASKVIAHYAFFRKVSFLETHHFKEKKNVALLDELTHFLNHSSTSAKNALWNGNIFVVTIFIFTHIYIMFTLFHFLPAFWAFHLYHNLSPPFFFVDSQLLLKRIALCILISFYTQ